MFEAGAGIYVVSTEAGKPIFIAKGSGPVWNDTTGTIVYSSAEPGKNYSLYEIPFSSKDGKVIGAAKPLTFGRGRDIQASVALNGKRIAFTSQEISFNMEIMPFDAEAQGQTGEPVAISTGNDVIYFMNFFPDGRAVVFESRRGSRSFLWRRDLDGGLTQLTSDPKYDDSYPRYSPEGKRIAFDRKSSEKPDAGKDLWIMASDGANPQPLGFDLKRIQIFFTWTPDGKSLIYQDASDSQYYLQNITTKKRTRLTNEPHVAPASCVSPDGKWLAYQSTHSGNVDIHAVLIAGGTPQPVVATPSHDYHPFISPSGKWLYFQKDHKNIFRVPGPALNWQKAEPQKITHFPESGLYLDDPQISIDGSKLLYSRGKITGDIWLMEFH